MAEALLLKTLAVTSLAGALCGLTGGFIFLLNIPFIGVLISHAAMAGGIWGIIAGVPPKAAAFAASLIAVFAAGPVSDRAKLNANISMSIIFSAFMGIAFLGVGITGGMNQQIMGFLWGNVLFAGIGDIVLITALIILTLILLAAKGRQYEALLFNREIAASLGYNTKALYYGLLLIIGAVITVTLDVIGGLMLFSLIITPPAIAYQLTYDMKRFFGLSLLAGFTAGLGGAFISYLLNLPVSATTVLFVSLLFSISFVFSPKRRRDGR
ncbi:MAG TPA: metal ABC transporter permease [bacterium]|nr:metal ABC transporter permease [bacterium]